MKKQFTLNVERDHLRPYSGYPKIGSTLCYLTMLFIVFFTACKKDDFTGEVIGLCPVVVSTDPMNLAVDVPLDKLITVTFNTAMNPATLNSTSFTIKQGSTVVPGVIAATSNKAVFTFKPNVPLLPFTKYTGTITTAATDTLRTAMVADYVWTFTTIPVITTSSNPSAAGTTAGGGSFAQGSAVTVTATPISGFTFTNWTEGGNQVSTSASYSFTMAGNRNLVANFAPVPIGQFAVNLSSSPPAGGTTTGAGSYDTGASVTATASPNPGFVFVEWTENGVRVSTSSSIQFFITANRTFVANFRAIPASQVALVLSSNPPAGGTTDGEGAYPIGTSVTAIASQNTGYTFTNWTDLTTGAVLSTSPNYTFVLSANRSLRANFTLNTYTLTTSGANGTVTKAPDQPTYNHGSTVVLTATPSPGFVFTSWGGDASGSTNPLTVTMDRNKTITALFTAIPVNTFTLTVIANNGSVTKNPNTPTYASGSTVQLTAAPNTGFRFTGWSGDATGSTNPLTVTMNANKTITANFAPLAAPLFTSIFGAFGGSAGITNQGINTRIVNGSIGTTGVSTLITGFHDGTTGDVYTETPLNIGLVTGRIHTAPPPPGSAASALIATNALAAMQAFYISISPANRPNGIILSNDELGGRTLAPGTYKSANGTYAITNGNLTLDAQGDPDAVWVFQVPTALTVGIAGPTGARSIILAGGAQARNVYWYVGSAATINGAGGGIMVGTIISSAGVTFSTSGNTTQTVLNGRALSLVASVTMVNTTINVPQ
ncbi:InlB B-repeat-containing protein [Daejeonella sp.]|uniref:InlB B-repeat-containing protein n=1 Tax=Daejeonella sp. TaxID=2805397 RepID=UPI003983AB82